MTLRQAFAIGALILPILGLAWGCKPKQTSEAKAVIFDATHAMALVPSRLSVSSPKALVGHQGVVWDNATKAVVNLITCQGADAAVAVNQLEGLVDGAQNALSGLDRVKHSGANIMIADMTTQVQTPVAQALKLKATCTSQGLMSIGAIMQVLGDNVTKYASNPAKQQTVFNTQAFFWMAMRGPYQGNNIGFSGVFYRMLAESLGFYPDGSASDQQARIAAIDAELNPCAGNGPANLKALKDAMPFACSAPLAQCATKICNYQVKDSKTQTYSQFLAATVGSVDQANNDYWNAFKAKAKPADLVATDGADLAWSLSTTEATLKAKIATIAAPKAPASSACPTVDPMTLVAPPALGLQAELSTLEQILAIHVAPSAGSTLSRTSGLTAVGPPKGSDAPPPANPNQWFKVDTDPGRCFRVVSIPPQREQVIFVAQPTTDNTFIYGEFYPLLDRDDLKMIEGTLSLNSKTTGASLGLTGGGGTTISHNGVTLTLATPRPTATGLGLAGPATQTRGLFNGIGRLLFGRSESAETYAYPGTYANAYEGAYTTPTTYTYPATTQAYYAQPGAVGGAYYGETGYAAGAEGGYGYSAGYPSGGYGLQYGSELGGYAQPNEGYGTAAYGAAAYGNRAAGGYWQRTGTNASGYADSEGGLIGYFEPGKPRATSWIDPHTNAQYQGDGWNTYGTYVGQASQAGNVGTPNYGTNFNNGGFNGGVSNNPFNNNFNGATNEGFGQGFNGASNQGLGQSYTPGPVPTNGIAGNNFGGMNAFNAFNEPSTGSWGVPRTNTAYSGSVLGCNCGSGFSLDDTPSVSTDTSTCPLKAAANAAAASAGVNSAIAAASDPSSAGATTPSDTASSNAPATAASDASATTTTPATTTAPDDTTAQDSTATPDQSTTDPTPTPTPDAEDTTTDG